MIKIQKSKRGWQYWARLLGVGLLALYALFVTGFAWMNATAMIRPSRHEVCCASPADFGAEYEALTLLTPDGIRLFGWYIPSQNGAAVILLHGYGGDRTSSLIHARMLSAHGYGVLLYDQRASGESEGEARSWGWRDVADVESALGFLRERSDVTPARIGVLGCSTRAEIAIGAGARFDEIGAIVADAPYYTIAGDAWPPYEFKDWVGWPVYPLLITFMEWQSGASAPMSLREAVTHIAPRPLLLIAAERSAYEQWRAQHYFALASEPKDYWVVDGATHCRGPIVEPEQYETRIVNFFDRALLEP